MEKADRIPDSVHSKFVSITSKTDAFCQRYLNDEYRQLVRTAVAALCRKRPSPLLRGSDFWAAGFIHAIGTANFVFDKSQTPHCTAPDIYSFFGVASSTGQGKSKQIRQWLKIRPLSFEWGLPSKFDSNPLIWMLTGKRNDGRRSTFTNRGPRSCLSKRTDSVCPWRQALLTTDIQALVLGVRKECFCCKMAAGNTTVGSTPICSGSRQLWTARSGHFPAEQA